MNVKRGEFTKELKQVVESAYRALEKHGARNYLVVISTPDFVDDNIEVGMAWGEKITLRTAVISAQSVHDLAVRIGTAIKAEDIIAALDVPLSR